MRAARKFGPWLVLVVSFFAAPYFGQSNGGWPILSEFPKLGCPTLVAIFATGWAKSAG
jgi:hypothetical protein